ncbi:hypothetical protein [Carnimonas bestiolae]|uniref:hypothetical protein n=1 Tax=Carnimonas bestiolae TaxID=3402172 RepID=UPI003EDBB960
MANKRHHSRRFMLLLVIVLGATSITQGFSNWRKSQALDGFWDRMQLSEQRVSDLREQQQHTNATLNRLISEIDHADH